MGVDVNWNQRLQDIPQLIRNTKSRGGFVVRSSGAIALCACGFRLCCHAPSIPVIRIGSKCKRWRTPAGESIVRDFYGMMQHEKADQGAIIATSGFSKAAIEWAKGKRISLYNDNDFLKLWKKVKEQQHQGAQPG
ncbi:MAG: restriction endonuclease [Chloroflexi bacterium]|nr:restriction endonuclease [Chloroflexota bacterium]